MPKLRRPRLRLLQLLTLIQQHRMMSRADVVAKTGYSTFLVSRMSDELLQSGFLRETGIGSSTGGRPPALLSVNPDLGELIGVHLGTVNVRVVVTDMAGEPLYYEKDRSQVQSGPEASLKLVVGLIRKAMSKAKVTSGRLRGLGIGISGVLSRDTGTTLYWPKVPQWNHVPVRQILTDEFQTITEVEDTPRTMALAEKSFGGAGDADPFLYVTAGAGVGAAMYLNGSWFTGANGFAGEFGHLTVAEEGLCSCGNRGCVESLVSASALIRRARRAVVQNLAAPLWRLCEGQTDRVSVEQIVKAADHGDRFCLDALERSGSYLGLGLAGMVNLLNPALIILGGGMVQEAGRILLPAALRTLEKRALPQLASSVDVRLSTLSETDWARGAALLVSKKALEAAFDCI